MGYSFFLMDQCLFEEAIAEMELALQLDPLSLPVNRGMGLLFFNSRHYREAISQLVKTEQLDPASQLSELDPTFHLSRQLLGACLEREQKHDEAVSEYLRMIPESMRPEKMTSALMNGYAESGMKGFWRSFAGFAPELSERRVITPLFVASIYASLGERDEAFEWIEQAFSKRSPTLSHIKADPRFETLHSSLRRTVRGVAATNGTQLAVLTEWQEEPGRASADNPTHAVGGTSPSGWAMALRQRGHVHRTVTEGRVGCALHL